MWTACRAGQGRILEWGEENLLKSEAGLAGVVGEGGARVPGLCWTQQVGSVCGLLAMVHSGITPGLFPKYLLGPPL